MIDSTKPVMLRKNTSSLINRYTTYYRKFEVYRTKGAQDKSLHDTARKQGTDKNGHLPFMQGEMTVANTLGHMLYMCHILNATSSKWQALAPAE